MIKIGRYRAMTISALSAVLPSYRELSINWKTDTEPSDPSVKYTPLCVVTPGSKYEETVHRNKNHFSYINNISAYFNLHQCENCGRRFEIKQDLNRHIYLRALEGQVHSYSGLYRNVDRIRVVRLGHLLLGAFAVLPLSCRVIVRCRFSAPTPRSIEFSVFRLCRMFRAMKMPIASFETRSRRENGSTLYGRKFAVISRTH